MSSLVREATQKLITIENPLSHPVEIKKEMIIVESDTVFVSPLGFTIAPKSVRIFLFSNSAWSSSIGLYWQRKRIAS
jgi:hypothetical protein